MKCITRIRLFVTFDLKSNVTNNLIINIFTV